jgi:hypothetical protein
MKLAFGNAVIAGFSLIEIHDQDFFFPIHVRIFDEGMVGPSM